MSLRAVGVVAVVLLGMNSRAQGVAPSFKRTLEVLGGERKLASVTSLTATGPLRTTSSTTGTVELAFRFPDYFKRTEELSLAPGVPALVRTSVLDRGSASFDLAAARADSAITVTPAKSAQSPEGLRVLAEDMQGELERLHLVLLGAAGRSDLEGPYVAEVEAPEGRAHAFDVALGGRRIGRLIVDAKSGLPLMLLFEERVAAPPAKRGPTPGDPGKMVDQLKQSVPKTVLRPTALYLADYHDVQGVRLPRRISKGPEGSAATEDWEPSYKLSFKK